MYSQNAEEQHIVAACAGAPRRRLLDIGAFHPTQFSNSRALIELGWHALLVEPSPGPLRALVQEYGARPDLDVTILSAAVGMESGQLMRLRISDDGVSSADVAAIAKWEKMAQYLGWLVVPQITIPEILNRSGDFDFVSIDAEGTSVDLLHALLATEMLPRCICCEHDDRLVEAQMAAQARGYRTVYVSAENLVLVHE